ncbi:MAG: Holliday junction resolvase RuvX [Pyrinomonadaceae bacterium]
MQDKETSNPSEFTDLAKVPLAGRIVSLDLGTKWIGVAVSDELQMLTRPVRTISRTSWKKTLLVVKDILNEFDAVALVIGLPYNFDGTESEMSVETRKTARSFSLSLEIPVFLQDERATSYEAKRRLWERGVNLKSTKQHVDSEAAAIILSDFLDRSRR